MPKFIYHKCEECGHPTESKFCLECLGLQEMKRKTIENARYAQGKFIESGTYHTYQEHSFFTSSGPIRNRQEIKNKLRDWSRKDLLELFADLLG